MNFQEIEQARGGPNRAHTVATFHQGDHVRVLSGPSTGESGIIDSIQRDKRDGTVVYLIRGTQSSPDRPIPIRQNNLAIVDEMTTGDLQPYAERGVSAPFPQNGNHPHGTMPQQWQEPNVAKHHQLETFADPAMVQQLMMLGGQIAKQNDLIERLYKEVITLNETCRASIQSLGTVDVKVTYQQETIDDTSTDAAAAAARDDGMDGESEGKPESGTASGTGDEVPETGAKTRSRNRKAKAEGGAVGDGN